MHTRAVFALLCGTALVTPAAPLSAAETVHADAYAVFAEEGPPGGGGPARILLACTGQGGDTTVTIEITCEMYDSSGDPEDQIVRRRRYAGPACACAISAFDLRMPITYCSTAVATFSNAQTATDRTCTTIGSPAPQQIQPPPHSPRILECLDLAGTGR